MIPTSEGVWRWKRRDDGRVFDLPVYNVGSPVGELYLRVYFLGSYYDVDTEMATGGKFIAKVNHNPNGHITKQHQGWVHPLDFSRE